MSNLVNLKNFRDREKNHRIIKELELVIHIYNLSLEGLKHFSKYSLVQETISVLQANKILLEIHLKKYKNMVV